MLRTLNLLFVFRYEVEMCNAGHVGDEGHRRPSAVLAAP